MVLLGIAVFRQDGRDPALTGNEPVVLPNNSVTVFATHHDLLEKAVDYFEDHHQVFDVIREEGDVSSGFFASDTDADAIRAALGADGVELIRCLNEKACLRSIAYYMQTKDQAPALLFNFVTQAPESGLLIYVYPRESSQERETVAQLSRNHGLLLPLAVSGWYYIER